MVINIRKRQKFLGVFFDWRDNPLEKDHASEGLKYYRQALLTDNACWMLSHSNTIQASFETYGTLHDIPITTEKILEHGDYCSDEKSIRVSTLYSRWYRPPTVAHEVRHGIQDIEGVLTDGKKESRRSNVLLSEGDAVAYEITVSYELRDKFPQIWKSLKNTNERYRQLCHVFGDVVGNAPHAIESGYASQMVLERYISIPHIRKTDFDHYFKKPKKFRRPISPSGAFRSLDSYHKALIGIPYISKDNEPHKVVERDGYMHPEDTEIMVSKLRGLTL